MESKYLVSIVEASKMFGIGRDSLYAMSRRVNRIYLL